MVSGASRVAYLETGLAVLSDLGYGGLKLAEVCNRLRVISLIDNDRLHDSYRRCFDTSPPDTAAACPPALPLPILRGPSKIIG
jgi:hypothetical protein